MIQILKLGISGSESTLPTESRINLQGVDTPFLLEARSVNGTLHTDFVNTKGNFAITWSVMSDADFDALYAIYKLQFTNATHLSYIYTDATGTEYTKIVRVDPPTKGSLIVRDVYYNNAINLTMVEV